MKHIIPFLLITCTLQAQKDTLRQCPKNIVHYSAAFTAGSLDGSIEALSHHYEAFERTFHIKNDQFWNSAVSWKNKYQEGNPLKGEKFLGSTGIFVAATDGYHLLRCLHKATSLSMILTFDGKRQSLKSYIKKAILLSVSYTAGKFIMYNLIIK